MWWVFPLATGAGVSSVDVTGTGELRDCSGSGSATAAGAVVGVGGSLRGFCDGGMFSEV